MRGFFLSLLLRAAALPLPPNVPEQIHLHLTGTAGEMAVDFASAFPGAAVVWGGSPSNLSFSSPAATVNVLLNGFNATLSTAVMAGLAPNATYWYSVGDARNGFSALYSFTSQPAREGGAVFCIFADLGLNNAVALPSLVAGVEQGRYDYVVLAGDQSYDFDSQDSQVGNAYMNAIQPIAARLPFMVAPGNHVRRRCLLLPLAAILSSPLFPPL